MPRAPLVCGVDEAGRGPLAGPVFAACVVLDPRRPIRGLADSKTLAAERREELAVRIRERALAWTVASSTVEEIDELNILQASLLAMRRAVGSLTVQPEEVVIDGNQCPTLPFPVRSVVRGDASVRAISAASILAKVARDRFMIGLHEQRPEYGFDRHKGYATVDHLQALRAHGVSEFHRRTFAPVRELLLQLPLF
jgi:ribonuclease HII